MKANATLQPAYSVLLATARKELATFTELDKAGSSIVLGLFAFNGITIPNKELAKKNHTLLNCCTRDILRVRELEALPTDFSLAFDDDSRVDDPAGKAYAKLTDLLPAAAYRSASLVPIAARVSQLTQRKLPESRQNVIEQRMIITYVAEQSPAPRAIVSERVSSEPIDIPKKQP